MQLRVVGFLLGSGQNQTEELKELTVLPMDADQAEEVLEVVQFQLTDQLVVVTEQPVDELNLPQVELCVVHQHIDQALVKDLLELLVVLREEFHDPEAHLEDLDDLLTQFLFIYIISSLKILLIGLDHRKPFFDQLVDCRVPVDVVEHRLPAREQILLLARALLEDALDFPQCVQRLVQVFLVLLVHNVELQPDLTILGVVLQFLNH